MSAADVRAIAYGEGALRAAARDVATAQLGGRNNALVRAAFALGRLIGCCGLREDDISKTLLQAARDCGLTDSERAIKAAISRAITAGLAKPRELPDERAGPRPPPAPCSTDDAHAPIRQRERRVLSSKWRKLFEECRPVRRETIGGIYLLCRQCALPPEDSDLREHPDIENWVSKSRWPALVGLITDAITNMPISLHFTFLAKDGSGKTPIDPPRLYLARHEKAGGVVRLWPDAHVTHGLLIGEGIETTLSAARAFQPAWACLDADNVGNFPALPGIEAVIIAEDDDDAGRRGATTCADRWAAAGRDVRILRAA